MVDIIDLPRINNAIRNKSQSIIDNKLDVNNILDYIQNIKRQKHNNNNLSATYRIKNDIAEIKKLKKQMSVSRKELKIYENERKKKRNDPNYRIDFDLLEKKYNKNKCVM